MLHPILYSWAFSPLPGMHSFILIHDQHKLTWLSCLQRYFYWLCPPHIGHFWLIYSVSVGFSLLRIWTEEQRCLVPKCSWKLVISRLHLRKKRYVLLLLASPHRTWFLALLKLDIQIPPLCIFPTNYPFSLRESNCYFLCFLVHATKQL